MKQVGAYEAKTKLSLLLRDVEKGESITITKHGIPVAMLIPADNRKKRPLQDVIEELQQFQSEHTLHGLSLRDMIEKGRK